MKRASAVLVLAALVWALPASAGGVRISGPALSIEPRTHDFGQIAQGAVFHAQSVLRNGGTVPLQIRAIQTDCGCTAAQLADSTLLPGESTVLDITFSSRNFSGRVKKQVLVETNDPGMNRANILLNAFVRPWVRLDPSTPLEFGSVPRGETPELTVVLRSARSDGMRILSLDADTELFTTRTEEAVEGDSLVHRLSFRLRPDARTGVFRARARLKTTHPQAPDVSIRLNGQVHGFFRVEPTSVSFGQLRQGTARTREVHLIGAATGGRQVLSASCSDARIRVEKSGPQGRDYTIRVSLPADTPAGLVKDRLVIETDDPVQPRIEIPVRARIAAPGSASESQQAGEGEDEEEE